MAILKYWDGVTWQTVADGTSFKHWNGSWVNPAFVKYWSGTNWVKCWSKTDPITINVTADWTWSYHGPKTTDAWITGTGSDANGAAFTTAGYSLYGLSSGDMLQGNWSNNAYDVGSLGLQTGLMGFRDKIKSYLDVRPVITSAKLTLRGVSTYTDSVQAHIGTFSDTGSAPSTFPHTDTDKYSHITSEAFPDNTTVSNIVLNSTIRTNLATQYGLALHAQHNITPNSTRGSFGGNSSGYPPALELTIDYS